MSYVETPRATCALGGALDLVHSIERAVPIIHAGPGCGTVLNFGQIASGYQYIGYASGSATPSTNTLEREVVFGGEDRLREQIKTTLEIMDADLFLVISGCTAGIIGDDIQSVVNEFSDNGVTIAFAETSGFKGSTYTGYEIAYNSLLDQIVEPDVEKQENTVNLIGVVPAQDPFWQGNLNEIVRLLEKIGVKVNITGNVDSVEKIKKAAGVELNILLSANTGISIAKHFQEKFDVPYLQYPLPVGTDTSDFLREVGKALDLDEEKVEEVIAEEEEIFWKYLIKFSEAHAFTVSNNDFGIISDTNYVIGLTKFLTNDLGLHPNLVFVTDNPPEEEQGAIEERISTLNYGLSPRIFFEDDDFKIWEEITNNRPNLLFGSSTDKVKAQNLHIPLLGVSYPLYDRSVLSKAYVGYRGPIQLVEDLGDTVLSG